MRVVTYRAILRDRRMLNGPGALYSLMTLETRFVFLKNICGAVIRMRVMAIHACYGAFLDGMMGRHTYLG